MTVVARRVHPADVVRAEQDQATSGTVRKGPPLPRSPSASGALTPPWSSVPEASSPDRRWRNWRRSLKILFAARAT